MARSKARIKLQNDFIEALSADFARHGAGTLERVRANMPAQYMKICASLMPKEVELGEETAQILGFVRLPDKAPLPQ